MFDHEEALIAQEWICTVLPYLFDLGRHMLNFFDYTAYYVRSAE